MQGSSFKSEKGEWENVVVQAKFKIHITEGTAIANSKDNTYVLPTGTRLKLSEAYSIETLKGEIIWNNDKHDCKEYDFIYRSYIDFACFHSRESWPLP